MIPNFGAETPFAAAAMVVHVGAGTVAIVSGLTAMFAAKGARLHRLSGTVFTFSMLGMAILGAILAATRDAAPWTNNTASAFTLYMVATGWATVRRPAGRVGRFERVAVVFALAMAGMGLVLAIRYGATPRAAGFVPVFAFAAIAGLAAVCDLKMIRRGGLTGVARTLRHLWRMSAALFVATAAFFFGQADVLPAGFRATGLPIILGLSPLVLLVFWLMRTRFPRVFNIKSTAA